MAVYSFDGAAPDIHPTAFVHPDASVVGRVVIGAQSSVWARASVRGDVATVRIGAGSNVQDGAVVHAEAHAPTWIGDGVSIGHLSVVEGCTLEDGCLVGSGATILPGAVVETGAMVASGAVVRRGQVVPGGETAVGAPATLSSHHFDPGGLRQAASEAVALAERYREGLKPVDPPG